MAWLRAFSALALLHSAGALFPDCQNGPVILRNNTVCDTSAPAAQRAAAIVSLMTVAEKINNTGNTSPGVPRLGLPGYQWWSEALHGVAESPGVNFSTSGNYSYATSFPEPILMSAAFDDNLIHSVATVVSTEARAFNNVNRSGLDYWTPNINPYKDPRWGRGLETPGEDPFRIQNYIKNLVDGLQNGEDPNILKVVSTCKHFAGYDLENWEGVTRYGFNAVISTQDLAEYYLPPFQQCARDSKVGALMSSYNAVNGVPSSVNKYLVQDILRGHWGYSDNATRSDWITSDCDAVANVYSPHNYTSSLEQAAADAIQNIELDCGTTFPDNLPTAYQQGMFNESYLNSSLLRQYTSLVNLGYFDPPSASPYRSISWDSVSTPASQQLAYEAAVKGITLLKNDGILPLQVPPNASIALIGGWANATTQMQGNYYGVAPYLHSPLYAAQQLGLNVNYAPGPIGQAYSSNYSTPSMQAAQNSDLIIYVGGIDVSIEAEALDRLNVTWPAGQVEQINQVCSLGKKCVLVQMGGGQLDDTAWLNNDNISAIVWGGYPGQDGGTAILASLLGTYPPAGRLPVTQYPADYVTAVPMTNMSLRPGPGNPGRTYKWYPHPVLPFGYGLSYSTFSASFNPPSTSSFSIQSLLSACTQPYLDLCPFANLTATVRNTGSIATDFVALAFVSGAYGPAPYPLKQLVGYQRLYNVTGGSAQTASFALTLGNLARVDASGNAVLYPGAYALLLDVPTQATLNFTLVGEQAVLDNWPQPPANESMV